MRTRPWFARVTGAVLGCSLLIGSAASVAAQAATPAPGAACTVAPRSIDELIAVWFGPEGTPPAAATESPPVQSEAELPQGSPADAETVAAINATIHEFFACYDQGKVFEMLALASNDFVRLFGPNLSNPEEDTPEEVRAILEEQLGATPEPGDLSTVPTVVSDARDARVLEDGRVGALFESEGDIVFIIFEKGDGRWLVDEFVDVLEGTAPAGGTPTS
jgi:hypothetical protein